ncbi:hypothetical protein H0H93_006792 [Arthromyces matolae]|nr:hypothetical protein H0H93_006792 [Arthromyces matolae]
MKFIFIAHSSSLCAEWKEAIHEYYPNPLPAPFTVIQGKLEDIDPLLLKCDCIVSPANSYAIMDGGYVLDYWREKEKLMEFMLRFDLQLSKSLQSSEERNAEVMRNEEDDSFSQWALTDHCQTYLSKEWHGYAPPGSCTIVPLPDSVVRSGNKWQASSLAILPTMRTPQDVSWHKDLVYNAMWSLLIALERWNRNNEDHPHRLISTVLMTGLATGVGGISKKRAARQMVLAVRHFQQQALASKLRWGDVESRNDEIRETEQY